MRLIDADALMFTDIEIVMCDGDFKKAFKLLTEKIENAPSVDQGLTKVICWQEHCHYNKNGICAAEKIELYDEHDCDGGCDDGWLMGRRADE